MSGPIEIRSYRAVFDLERRVYRIDRLRLNPAGVPVRGIVYFLAILACCALLGALPGISMIASAAPWYIREVALPAGLAALLVVLRIDGRPFHIAALSVIAHLLEPRELLGAGGRLAPALWQPLELLLLPDGSDPQMRRMRYMGPGAVLVAVAHQRREMPDRVPQRLMRRPQLVLSELPDRSLAKPQLIELAGGARLQVR
jgi:hypothetical protein